jgi:hypothetical protein
MATYENPTLPPAGRPDGGSAKSLGILKNTPSRPQGDDGYTPIGIGSAYDRAGLAARGKTIPNAKGGKPGRGK